MALPKTVKKLLTLQQVNVNFCWNGKTPIMIVGCHSGSDEQCAEVYDELIKAGALKHSKSEDLWYVLHLLACFIEKLVIAIIFMGVFHWSQPVGN